MKPRILVARLGAIGDICLLTPVVHALTRHAEVDWLIRDSHVPLVQGFPQLRCRLIGAAPAADVTQPYPAELVAALRRRDYQAFIDFSHWQSIAWLAGQLSDIPVRAITQDPEQDALLGLQSGPLTAEAVFNCLVPVPPRAHQVSKWLTLVRSACGLELALDWPLPALRPLPRNRALRIFLHPHASKPEKIWPVQHFTSVLSRLARRQRVHVVVNGVRRRLSYEIRFRLALSRVSCEVAPLDPTYDGLRRALLSADLAFGCDSGPLQFAALLGIPSLVLYGRYQPEEFGPLWRSVAISPPQRGQDVDAIAPAQVDAALQHWVDSQLA
jgi:ADP-heptose:LPS heptosyltransferase